MLKFSFVDIFNFYLWGCIINIITVIALCIHDKSIKIMIRDWESTLVFIMSSYIGLYYFLKENIDLFFEYIYKRNKTLYSFLITIQAGDKPTKENRIKQYWEKKSYHNLKVTGDKMSRYFMKKRGYIEELAKGYVWETVYTECYWEYIRAVEIRFIKRYSKG